MGEATDGLKVETYHLADDGTVPNNALPLVLYRGALQDEGDRASACERMFDRNGWPGAWRNGIYGHHHYHSTAHEVLGIAAGRRGCGSAAKAGKASSCARVMSS
jgi:uncharacterized protein YjlB